jgi:hypothetical protein
MSLWKEVVMIWRAWRFERDGPSGTRVGDSHSSQAEETVAYGVQRGMLPVFTALQACVYVSSFIVNPAAHTSIMQDLVYQLPQHAAVCTTMQGGTPDESCEPLLERLTHPCRHQT